MNILYMRYAVEVAKTGSVNKASDNLYVAQPNLSRAVKELEADLGVSLFKRTSKGMMLTRDGEKFIRAAEHILAEMDDLQSLFGKGVKNRIAFSLSAPGCCRISAAFANFTGLLPPDAVSEITYTEASAADTLENVTHGGCRLGIIRYAPEHDESLKEELDGKGLRFEALYGSRREIITSSASPLANRPSISEKDLLPYTEAACDSIYVPLLSKAEKDTAQKRIFAKERASRYELIRSNPDVYARECGVMQSALDRYGLVKKVCEDDNTIYRDVLIYRNGCRLTDYDKLFISCLNETLQNK